MHFILNISQCLECGLWVTWNPEGGDKSVSYWKLIGSEQAQQGTAVRTNCLLLRKRTEGKGLSNPGERTGSDSMLTLCSPLDSFGSVSDGRALQTVGMEGLGYTKG